MKAFQSNKVQITGPAKAGEQGDTAPPPQFLNNVKNVLSKMLKIPTSCCIFLINNLKEEL